LEKGEVCGLGDCFAGVLGDVFYVIIGYENMGSGKMKEMEGWKE
jgi:hypothetical protein